MRKVIAAINMTLDGFCDHTSVDADDELHDHYTALLRNAGTLLYGRITYQLMEDFWPTLLRTPSGIKALDEFAAAIDSVPKVVFSRTLKNLDWDSARLATKSMTDEVLELRKQSGKDIFVGSPSLIVSLAKTNLIDEYQLCVHPVIVGSGLPLFKNITEKISLKLLKTKILKSSGAVLLYYEPNKK